MIKSADSTYVILTSSDAFIIYDMAMNPSNTCRIYTWSPAQIEDDILKIIRVLILIESLFIDNTYVFSTETEP